MPVVLRSLRAYSRLVAATFPHQKHVPPDIKRNRVPAPGLRFDQPSLPFILDEIEDL